MSKELNREKSSLSDVMKDMKKRYGETSVFRGSESVSIEVETLSTGSLALDAALLCGGYPKGRLIEVSGIESSGKTFLCLMAIKRAQQQGMTCAFVDAEHTLDRPWCEKLGIKFDDLIITRPDFTEDALTQIMMLARSGEVALIVWDSVPALPTKAESAKEMDEMTMGSHAKILTRAMRELTPICHKNNCTVLFINQIREKIARGGPMYGDPETTPGGRALKHHCSVRIKVTRVGSSQIEDSLKRTIGHTIRARVLKNKTSTAQGITVEFVIKYEEGIDVIDEIETVGIQCGVIQRPNKIMYSLNGVQLKGQKGLRTYLEEHPEEVKKLEVQIKDTMRNGIKTLPEAEAEASDTDSDLLDTVGGKEDVEGLADDFLDTSA